MDEQTDILLARYFGGEATEKELRRLDEWLAESVENEKLFDRMTWLYQQAAQMPPMPPPDVSEALRKFRKHMDEAPQPQKKPVIRMARFYRIAAASVILLAGLFTFYFLNNRAKPTQLATTDTTQNYNFSDNMEVELAPRSQISFDAKNENEIKLTGAAKFSVHKKSEKELVIHAGDTYIQDIGTIFTVNAHAPADSITVEVEQGEVWFYTLNNNGIRLKASEKGVYRVREKSFSQVGMQESLSEIIFNGNTLDEVIPVLEARFGAAIEMPDASLRTLQISVSFDKNESLDNILAIIAETLLLTVEKNENRYVISK